MQVLNSIIQIYNNIESFQLFNSHIKNWLLYTSWTHNLFAYSFYYIKITTYSLYFKKYFTCSKSPSPAAVKRDIFFTNQLTKLGLNVLHDLPPAWNNSLYGSSSWPSWQQGTRWPVDFGQLPILHCEKLRSL